ncbi:Uncharacterised protein [uncultured archaeon]|nr:Uncharacterised protein [uncultured archaeon]
MNEYYKKLEEARSLRLHADNLRAHLSRHNSFEFDIYEVAGRFDEKANEYENQARILEGRK